MDSTRDFVDVLTARPLCTYRSDLYLRLINLQGIIQKKYSRAHQNYLKDQALSNPNSLTALSFKMPGITSGLKPATSKSFIQRSGVMSG